MPRNGSGVYTLPAGNPVVTGTSISSTTQNTTMSDVASELTNSIAADGQKSPTANLPMGNFKHTGVADASARDQYASAGQVQDSSLIWCGTAGGTANALTFSPMPAITAYTAGQTFRFKAGASANTGATTIAVSGLAAIALEVNGAACVGGEIAANQWYEVLMTSPTNAQLRYSSTGSARTFTGDITMSGAKINFAAPVNIASASTVNLSTATSNTVNLTGTTAVTAWTMPAGTPFRVNFTAATPITYNATTNRIQGGSSITGEVGSYMLVYYDGTTTFVDYILGNGAAASGPSYTTSGTQITATGGALTNRAVGVCTSVASVSATSTSLPDIGTILDGQAFSLVNLGSGVATFNRVSTDLIFGCNLSPSGSTSFSLNKGENVTLAKNNGSYLITASNVSFLGAPQTWQNLTASRALTTVYTNSTGRDIDISVSCNVTGAAGSLGTVSITTDGVAYTGSSALTGGIANKTMKIVAGATYSASLSGSGTLAQFGECR